MARCEEQRAECQDFEELPGIVTVIGGRWPVTQYGCRRPGAPNYRKGTDGGPGDVTFWCRCADCPENVY